MKAIIAPCLLLIAALGPATSLMILRIDQNASFIPKDPVYRTLLTIFPLSTFLLAVLLVQARYRIRLLQAKEAEAVQSAGLDPLSKLPNRLSFDFLLETAMDRSTLELPIALFAIDIDHFKTINDTYGHQAGDQLIVGIAERIRRVIRDRDCLARVGGDEFSLMLAEVTSASQCAAMAHRLHDAMLAPFDTGDMQIFATLSIGVALSPQDGEARSVLMAAADLALYRAKHEGRNRFAFFDKTMEQKLHLDMTIEDDLREAIKADALTILYQPQISGSTGRLCGVEALVRWHHPRLGMISPEEFVPLAESRGLIGPLGEWVLRRACTDSRRWPSLRMAVNVSPVQFRNRGFVETVRLIIAESGIEPQRLELELTEGVLIQDADQAESVIMDLRAQGIRMGLDDFGSGYSSMIYLRRFAFDKIKIDKALLASMECSGEGAIIVDSIISLGHALGLTVTAEGVEQKDQVEFLQKLGCDELQGFYFSAPLPADEIDTMLSLEVWTQENAAMNASVSAA
ncbi:bifunctional diguanylate cyclase/phosphodiesterase [Beijerinckia sp. L45]|uniref:putative bifunctional diguanylate cyclase/phosphodiesterase n=1 Tax=Beijerinckia sp. L45 TaxID=1641855 RepID=UPI00131DED45|nr:EAL domain-containing protein [Beijerinckia sp. L45]